MSIKKVNANITVLLFQTYKFFFEKKYTNSQNFEHNFFLVETYIDIILNNNNFEIIEKEYYLDHSIIYITKNNNNPIIQKSFKFIY